jgi:threonine/homoserine/homoserine lactone efflux protein
VIRRLVADVGGADILLALGGAGLVAGAYLIDYRLAVLVASAVLLFLGVQAARADARRELEAAAEREREAAE